jgi:hypothetical protein
LNYSQHGFHDFAATNMSNIEAVNMSTPHSTPFYLVVYFYDIYSWSLSIFVLPLKAMFDLLSGGRNPVRTMEVLGLYPNGLVGDLAS